MKTTFAKIKEHSPCQEGWKKLISYYHPESLDEEVSIEEIIKSNGVKDAIWALRAIDDKKSIVLFACDCAEYSLKNYEKEFPNDTRVKDAIQAARDYVNGNTIEDQLLAARSAAESAWSAAESAWSAARSAAESAARSAAESARSAAESAWSAAESAWSAAWSAAESAARSAAESARSVAESAWSAAWSAAESAAYKYFETLLQKYF